MRRVTVLLLALVVTLAFAQAPAGPSNPHVNAALVAAATTNSCTGTTCWYVRPNGGAYGTENGTSWTNAYDGFSDITWASVACGDIIWVAGGTYTQGLTPSKNCSAGTRLEIRRARADDLGPTLAAGWSSGFDSTITHRPGAIEMQNGVNGILISGRTTAAGGTYGWLVSRSGSTSGSTVDFSSGGNNSLLEYLDLEGAGEINVSGDMRGIDLTPSASVSTGNIFSHLAIHDLESGVYAVNCSTPTFEYIDMYDIAPLNTATFHPNGIITWGCATGIVRHSTFRKGPNGLGTGEGVFFEQSGGSTAWQIYGNIFYQLNYTGVKAIEISAAVGAIKIYNNTFDDIITGTINFTDSPTCASGEYKNNLSISATHNTSSGGCSLTASNNTAASASTFINRTSHDYHLVVTTGAGFGRNAGTSLGSPYDTDRDATTRGGDGTWDTGAYEYTP